MKPTSTIEDYLKTIFEISYRSNNALVPLGAVSKALSITAGTVTTMIKRMEKDRLVTYQFRQGCSLTAEGKNIALQTIRRHRVLETFLVNILGIDWSLVHEEAEKMEHSTSDLVINKMWNVLNRPLFDPHGDPIPDENLIIHAQPEECSVKELKDGSRNILTHLSDRNPALLEELQKAVLFPGSTFIVERHDDIGVIELKGLKGCVTISLKTAASIWAKSVHHSTDHTTD